MEHAFASIKEIGELMLAPVVFCALVIWIWREASAIRHEYLNSNEMPEPMRRLWGRFRRAGFPEQALYLAMMTGFAFLFFYSIKFANEYVRPGLIDAAILPNIAAAGMGVTLVVAIAICGFYSARRFYEKWNTDGAVAWTPPRVTVFFSAVFAPFGLVVGLREILHETPDAIRLLHYWIIHYF